MLPPHIRNLGRMWATKTFVFEWRGRKYSDAELEKFISDLIDAGDVETLIEIGVIDRDEYESLQSTDCAHDDISCDSCVYARPASEGPKGGFGDRVLEAMYGNKQHEIWCTHRNQFKPKDFMKPGCYRRS